MSLLCHSVSTCSLHALQSREKGTCVALCSPPKKDTPHNRVYSSSRLKVRACLAGNAACIDARALLCFHTCNAHKECLHHPGVSPPVCIMPIVWHIWDHSSPAAQHPVHSSDGLTAAHASMRYHRDTPYQRTLAFNPASLGAQRHAIADRHKRQ